MKQLNEFMTNSLLEYSKDTSKLESHLSKFLDKNKFTLEIEKDIRGDKFTIMDNDKEVAQMEYMGIQELEFNIQSTKGVKVPNPDGNYLLMGTIVVNKEYRRQGIYTELINASTTMALKMGAKGLASLQWDIDSGEYERSPEATLVWDKLVKSNKATVIISETDDEEDTTFLKTK
tara:strand:+ start:181 stop:705 length:525 start_codon:yes stop_codon:yes gene_type:complete